MLKLTECFEHRRRDRRDGWRVAAADPIVALVPYILRTRLDSQNLFDTEVDISALEAFVRSHTADIPGISAMTVIMAAMVRLIALRPCLNRFIVHNKLYAHNTIKISVAVKRGLSDSGGEALIKPEFDPDDTLADVVRKTVDEIGAAKLEDASNASDRTAKLLGRLPPFLKRMAVGLIFHLDNIGVMPKAVEKASPWHTSAFITNVGSLGIDSIYHHLYEFGTCSIFIAMGKKKKEMSGTRETRRIRLRFVLDERICDGHYYALSMRYLHKMLMKPEQLLEKPRRIFLDDEIISPRTAAAAADVYAPEKSAAR